MARYEVRFKTSVKKDLRRVPARDVRRILDRIDQLAENPRDEGCVKLSGENLYRTRVGVYRIVYQIIDDRLVVVVVKVGHRSSVYSSHSQ